MTFWSVSLAELPLSVTNKVSIVDTSVIKVITCFRQFVLVAKIVNTISASTGAFSSKPIRINQRLKFSKCGRIDFPVVQAHKS